MSNRTQQGKRKGVFTREAGSHKLKLIKHKYISGLICENTSNMSLFPSIVLTIIFELFPKWEIYEIPMMFDVILKLPHIWGIPHIPLNFDFVLKIPLLLTVL